MILIFRGDDHGFNVVNGPNPGSASNLLGGIAPTGNAIWAVGIYDDGGSNLPLIERHAP